MNEKIDILTPTELGSRLKLVRQGLQLKQQEVASIIGTSQIKISKIEQGASVTTPIFLKLLAFYSQSISLDILFSEKIDFVTYQNLFTTNYAMSKIAKEKLLSLQKIALDSLQKASEEIKTTLNDAIHLL
jgi:hypothetical protein